MEYRIHLVSSKQKKETNLFFVGILKATEEKPDPYHLLKDPDPGTTANSFVVTLNIGADHDGWV